MQTAVASLHVAVEHVNCGRRNCDLTELVKFLALIRRHSKCRESGMAHSVDRGATRHSTLVPITSANVN